MKKNENKFGYFNILRFIGAICIAILLHWNDHLLPAIEKQNTLSRVNNVLFYISKNSYVFTEMFYLISGFLFAKVYIDRINNDKEMNLKKFISSRYIRIFPLVIISTIVMYILHLIYFNKFNIFFNCGSLKIDKLLADVLFAGTATFGIGKTPINGPLWYIGPLMLCYILAYYLTKKHKNNKYFLFIPIIIGIVVLTKNINFFIFNRNVARGLLSFFVGVLLGNKNLLDFFDNMSKKKKVIIKSIMFLIIILFILIIIFNKSELYIGDFIDNVLTYSLVVFPIIILFLYNIKWINYIGNTKLFKFLGNISFSIYVWNFPILITLAYLIKIGLLNYTSSAKFMFLSFIIHIIVASLSYILIEKLLTKKIKKKIIL